MTTTSWIDYEIQQSQPLRASRSLTTPLTQRASCFAPVDEGAMYREVLEFLGLGEPVPLTQCTEVVAVGERFEIVFCRAGIDQDDPVGGAEADVQAHPLRARGISSSMAS